MYTRSLIVSRSYGHAQSASIEALWRGDVRFSKFIILAVYISICYAGSSMELYSLQVFLAVATEKSFSRAAEKLLRTQPAVSLSLHRLETELGERVIDRSGKELVLTDAGRVVLEYSRRFENLRLELENSLAELRDNSA